MCVCVCVCVCVFVCEFLCVCVCVYVRVYKRVCSNRVSTVPCICEGCLIKQCNEPVLSKHGSISNWGWEAVSQCMWKPVGSLLTITHFVCD